MDKILQTKAWNCLPKEFKEEVKDDYKELVSALDYFQNKISLNNEECDRCDLIREKRAIYNKYFGHHNLTSDAEGEEYLCIERNKVQKLYDGLLSERYVVSISNPYGGTITARLYMLKDLFGSKCLPDDVATSAPNVDSSVGNVESLEPKPAEPKFKVGDYVRYKGGVHKVVATAKDNRCYLNKILGCIDESDLEPYTEPEKNIAETRNLSQDRDKLFDNILKTVFSKERRLAIAAQMMQGLICAPLVPGVDPNPSAEYLAQAAFRLADALIAESEKKGESK